MKRTSLIVFAVAAFGITTFTSTAFAGSYKKELSACGSQIGSELQIAPDSYRQRISKVKSRGNNVEFWLDVKDRANRTADFDAYCKVKKDTSNVISISIN